MEYESEIEQNWKKIVADSLIIGYRQGVIDGKDSVFQSGFSQGYAEGFKSGFALGTYKGALKASNTQASEDVLLNTRRGACVHCNDVKKSIGECVQAQRIHSDKLLKDLHSKYGGKCKVKLPDNLI